ncbi:hypothetical protein SDC9_82995 [bioreactor metagenome]|uniref:Uncharacterized protein n=1 Tax=bioreactor metagenome TaxID=1076179 RepID=A0A644Z700_9ZZZZ
MGAIHGNRLGAHPNIYVIFGLHRLRRLQQQRFPLLNDAADVIGQSAVGIRNVSSPLQQDNFRAFVQPAQSGRAAGPSGHAANNQNSFAHTLSPFNFDHLVIL